MPLTQKDRDLRRRRRRRRKLKHLKEQYLQSKDSAKKKKLAEKIHRLYPRVELPEG